MQEIAAGPEVLVKPPGPHTFSSKMRELESRKAKYQLWKPFEKDKASFS